MINFIPEFVQGLVPGHAPGMAGKSAGQEGSEDGAEGFAEFLDAVLYAGSAVAAVAVSTAAPEDVVDPETLLSMTEGEDDAGLTTEAAEDDLVEGAETEASESADVADEESSAPAGPRPPWAWGATRAQGAQEGQAGPVSGAPGAQDPDGPEAALTPEVPGSRAGELGAKAEGLAVPAEEGNVGRSGQAVGSPGEGGAGKIAAEGSPRAAAPAAAAVETARPVAPPPQAAGGPGAAGTAPVAEPVAPAQAAAAQSASAQSAAAQRVMQIVDALAQAPPPRTMTVDMGGQDGVRLTVALRGDAVHVTVRADGGGDPSAWAWVRDLGRDLGTALGHRGLEFGGFSTGADDDGGDRRERAEAAREERELAQARGKSQGRGPAPAASDQAVRL